MSDSFLDKKLSLEQNLNGSYYVASYGNFGYIVTLLAGIPFSGFIILPFAPTAPKFSSAAEIFIFLLGLLSCWIAIYSVSQLCRSTPRFVLDDNGFFYRGLLLRKYFKWSDIETINCDYSSQMGFVFLLIVFKFAQRWKRVRRLDVSGLLPHYKILLENMNLHLSIWRMREGANRTAHTDCDCGLF